MKLEELFPRVFDQLRPTMQPDIGRRYLGMAGVGRPQMGHLVNQHLGQFASQETLGSIEQLLFGLQELGLSPGMHVSGTGSLTLNVAGREIAIPLASRTEGVYQMAGSLYAGAMSPARRGGSNVLLNQTQAFVASALRGLRGESSALAPGMKPLQDFSPSGVSLWLQGLSEKARQSLKSIQISTGAADLSRAYHLGKRVSFPVSVLPPALKARYQQLQQLQKFTSMGGFLPGEGNLFRFQQWDPSTGTFTTRSLRKGDDLLGLLASETEAVKRGIVGFGQTLVPEGTRVGIAGLKPGAILPFLRESKGSGAERIFLTTLDPDQVAMAAGYQKLESGLHQQVKVMAFTREQLGMQGAKMGRISPIYSTAHYRQELDFYGRALGVGRGDVTSTLPVKLGLVHPGTSPFAHAWLERHLPDSSALMGKQSFVRHAARARWQHRVVRVPASYFRTGDILSTRLGKLMPGESIIPRLRGQEMFVGDVAHAMLRDLPQDAEELAGRLFGRPDVLGVSMVPGVETRVHRGDPRAVIEQITRKNDMFEFRLRQPLRRGMETATPAILGAGARRVMLSGVASLPRQVDVLAQMGGYGMKFGTEGAATLNTYLGHVFHRTQRLGKYGMPAAQALARRLGLQHAGSEIFASSSVDMNLFRALYGTFVAPGSEGSTAASRALARRTVGEIAQEVGLKGKDLRRFQQAFQVDFVPFSELVRHVDPAGASRYASEMAEATRLGAGMAMFEGSPLQIRTIESLQKSGLSGMELRLSELQTFQSSFALLPQGDRYRTAGEKLHRAMMPRISRSAAGSDVARLFGQFMRQPVRGLRDAPVYTLAEIAQGFSPLPSVRGEGPRVLRPEHLLEVARTTGRQTLFSEPGTALGSATLRRGGFYVKLPSAINLYLKEGMTPKAGISTDLLYVPGLEMFGKSTWGKHAALNLQGASRPGGPRQGFGDLEALVRQLHETAMSPGRDMAAVQERAQILLDSIQSQLPGRDSILRRYFTQRDMLQVSGQRQVLRGAGPEDALTVGVSEEVLRKGGAKGRKVLERMRGGEEVFGVTFGYPGFGRPHAQVVKYKLLRPEDLGLKAGEHMKPTIAFGSAISHMQQRDFDWDQAFATIFHRKRDTAAAQTMYARDYEQYRATQELLERGRELFEGMGGKDPAARAFRDSWIAEVQRGDGQEVIDRYLRGVIRQKTSTPFGHVTFRSQREAINLIGTQHEHLKSIVGDQALLDAMERVRNVTQRNVRVGAGMAPLGASAADWMYSTWASGIYDVLKKGKTSTTALEEVATVWEQFADLKEGITARKNEQLMARFEKSLTDLYTGGTPLEEILAGREGKNVVGTLALQAEQRAIEQRMAAAGTKGPVTAGEMSRQFFRPLAEFLADVNYATSGIRKLRETSSFSSLAPLFGETGADRPFRDVQGALGYLMRATGIGTDPQWVMDEGAARMFEDIHRRGTLGEMSQQVLETINEGTGKTKGLRDTAESIARQGRTLLSDIWRSKAGRIGVIGAGAFAGYHLLKGLVGPEDQPSYGFGGGAPMPPKPLLDTAAHHMQQAVPPQDFPARVGRPEAMQTRSGIRVRRTHEAPHMTMGYSSRMPAGMDIRHPEDENPEITDWQMQQYMAARMRSSY